MESGSLGLDGLVSSFDRRLTDFLAERRAEVRAVAPEAVVLIDEMDRLIAAGGKRIRPVFCVLGHLAAGGEESGGIVSAACALELLHTMALIHDDLMDESSQRRGAASVHVHLATIAPVNGDDSSSERFGRSGAILAGDLALVLADAMFSSAGFHGEVFQRAMEHYERMKIEMALGQYLDLAGVADARLPEGDAPGRAAAERTASLKGGSYTVEGPLLIGASLAGASEAGLRELSVFGARLGRAFQFRDDLRDGDAAPGITADAVNALVDEAIAGLRDGAPAAGLLIDPVKTLTELAEMVALR